MSPETGALLQDASRDFGGVQHSGTGWAILDVGGKAWHPRWRLPGVPAYWFSYGATLPHTKASYIGGSSHGNVVIESSSLCEPPRIHTRTPMGWTIGLITSI